MFILKLFSLCVVVSLASGKKMSPALKLLEKEKKNAKCKTTDFNTIMHLRAQQSDKKLVACLLKSLESSSGNGVLWSLLGEVFERKGHTSKANVCYKESIKHMGKVSKFIKTWHFIGPFTIGKNEVDGDPLQDWNGIKNVSRYRWKKNMDIHYSELIRGGEMKWTTITVNFPEESINVSPKADWNELILSLQSIAIAEWQGWIIGDFVVNEDSTVIVQCLGVSTLYVDQTMITGDLYKRDEFWHPVHLKRGIHSVMIKLRSKAAISIMFHLKQVQEKVPLNILSPPFLPDLVDGKLFSNFISLPVQNLQHSNWLKVVKVSLSKQDAVFTVSLFGGNEKLSIAPGQVKHIVLRVDYKDGSIIDNKLCKDVDLNLKLSFSGGRNENVDLTLRCRKMSESFLFTFLDHDGSVQHGAAIAPLKGCNSGVCPVLVTLHGTTVSPQSQADSYKRMEDGKWVFGLDNLWVLAPTRHGAHNWEGPGKLTAMKALEALSLYTKESSYFQSKADNKKIVISGHSMGGHGAWILGTHYPDQTFALISAAGWIRKEDYGDSNLFYRHDVSTSHVNPVVKAMMEACITENDADKHVSNLHGLSVMIRTGAADRTVHPYYSRRMYRLLRQQRSNVSYDEITGKEHWWWDTYSTNDGGVTNDPVIRGFAVKHAEFAGKSSSSNGICENGNGKCNGDDSAAKKYQQQQEDPLSRNHVGLFTLTVYNPASVDGVRGVRVVQQLIPFRQSCVEIHLSTGMATLRTTNVARISLSEPVVSPVHWDQRQITIDDTDINLTESSVSPGKSPVHLCRTGSYTWIVCGPEALESKLQRGPLNMGPARRIAESPFLIITGTTADQDTVDLLRQLAVYIANQFLLTSDSIAHVITDKELDEATADGFNLIVIGRPEQNTWSGRFHEHIPLKFLKNGLSLNGCHFHASRTGALSLAPHAGSRLSLLLTGNSLAGVKDVIDLATPTILPMARSPFSNMVPDFVVTGPNFGARGPGGYLCTGFWGNNWEYKREFSSCSC